MTRKQAVLAAVTRSLAASALSVALAFPTYAQKTTDVGAGNGGSPHVRTEWTVAPANISIEYGRPSIRGRPEAQLMPAGKPWRTGADAASVITTDKTLKFGSVTLPAGSYTINTVPGESEWHIVFGKLDKAGQWGIPYVPEFEIGRAPMTLTESAAPVEMLTFHIVPAKSAGTLKVEWGSKSASVAFTVLP